MKNQIVFIILLLMLFFASSKYSACQEKISTLETFIDSLARHDLEDTIKVILSYKIALQYYVSDPEKGIQFGKEGVALAEKLRYMHGLIFSLISTGVCYWAMADYPDALDYLLRALDISEKAGDKFGISKSSANLGNIFAEQKEYPKAMEYYNVALKTAREMKDTLGVARQLGNIGTILVEQKEYSRALQYYDESLLQYQAKGDSRGILVSYANIGMIKLYQSDYNSALDYYEKSLSMALESGEKRWIMYDYGNLGSAYFSMATDTSANYLRILRSLSEEQKTRYLNISLEYHEKAISIAHELSATKELINNYLRMSHSYKQLGRWKEAYDYLQLSHEAKDSVFKQENTIKIANLEAKRENEVKEKEIQIQKARLEKANTQKAALAGALIALFLIAVIIFRARRRSEQLLLNILPAKIAKRLKNKEKPIADRFGDAAVVFIDIAGFTLFSKDKDPDFIVEMLTGFFMRMDELSAKHGMEKIKTIGDRYMAVCGLPEPNPESVENAARFALEAQKIMNSYTTDDGHPIRVRIGIDAGDVVAGVIGEKKFSYDIWGDTVNTASRMESQGLVGEVQVTESVAARLSGKFTLTERGEIEVKGKGMMKTWLLTGSGMDVCSS